MRSTKAPYISLETLETVLLAQTGRHGQRNRVILLMSHFCGLRAMELANLTRGDVIDRKGEVKQAIQLTEEMTKGRKFREVFLMDERTRMELKNYTLENPGDPLCSLFKSQRHGFFTPNTMQKLIANCYKSAQIKASSHSGRRSYATRLIENGADIYSIKTLMGHSSISTTERYFTHNSERLKRLTKLLSKQNQD
ncbi:tyrosine-type recombinase/integrase [Comamonas sp. HJ-2]